MTLFLVNIHLQNIIIMILRKFSEKLLTNILANGHVFFLNFLSDYSLKLSSSNRSLEDTGRYIIKCRLLLSKQNSAIPVVRIIKDFLWGNIIKYLNPRFNQGNNITSQITFQTYILLANKKYKLESFSIGQANFTHIFRLQLHFYVFWNLNIFSLNFHPIFI